MVDCEHLAMIWRQAAASQASERDRQRDKSPEAACVEPFLIVDLGLCEVGARMTARTGVQLNTKTRTLSLALLALYLLWWQKTRLGSQSERLMKPQVCLMAAMSGYIYQTVLSKSINL